MLINSKSFPQEEEQTGASNIFDPPNIYNMKQSEKYHLFFFKDNPLEMHHLVFEGILKTSNNTANKVTAYST